MDDLGAINPSRGAGRASQASGAHARATLRSKLVVARKQAVQRLDHKSQTRSAPTSLVRRPQSASQARGRHRRPRLVARLVGAVGAEEDGNKQGSRAGLLGESRS